jgi:hypothetical protein
MYRHDIHKGFTFTFFLTFTIIGLISTVPSFYQVNEFTFMTGFIFTVVGALLYSDLYFGIHRSVDEKTMFATIFRILFAIPFYLVNCSLVLLVNWLLCLSGIIQDYYIWYTVVGGFTWLISFQLAKIFPNVPKFPLKKEKY